MNYFDESYSSKNGRWDIDIKKISEDKLHVCISNNSFNTKYASQYVAIVDKYGIEIHPSLPKYIKEEVVKIKKKYFSYY